METINYSIKNKNIDLILLSGVVLLWFFIPLISLVFIFILWNNLKEPSKTKDTFIIFLMSVTFGLVAYTGQSIGVDETDIGRYQFYYTVVSDIDSIGNFFVLMVLDGGSNLAFYIVNYLISRIYPENTQVHIMFWITVSYFFTLLGAYKALLYLGKPIPDFVSKFLIFVFLLGIMPFFTVTEIIKQCSSVSILFYALITKLLKERHSTKLLILALLVHASSLMLLPIYLFYSQNIIKRYAPLITFVCMCLSFFNFNVILINILSLLPGGALLAQAKEYQNVDVWSISLRHYSTFLLYGVLILLLCFDYFKSRKLNLWKEYEVERVNILMILFLGFVVLLINRGNVHNFVRYIYGLYPFYMLAIISMLKSNIKLYERYSIALLAICFFTFSNVKLLAIQTSTEVNYANSYYDNSWKNLLTSNIYQFLTFEIK